MNITIDGFCNHEAGIADDELHRHYSDLLKGAGAVLYGRVTYHLMEYWRGILENPTGNKATDEFAAVMDRVPKIVFSNTLNDTGWETATLAKEGLEKTVTKLKQQPGDDIFIGSPSLISALTESGQIDEYQLCIHPVIIGKGLLLFRTVTDRKVLKLLRTKTFGSGAVVHYYEPVKN